MKLCDFKFISQLLNGRKRKFREQFSLGNKNCSNKRSSSIDDIKFYFLAMHCGIGREIKQKNISQEYLICRKSNKAFIV